MQYLIIYIANIIVLVLVSKWQSFEMAILVALAMILARLEVPKASEKQRGE